MPSGRRRLDFDFAIDPEPERSFHRRLREARTMGDNTGNNGNNGNNANVAMEMAELRRQMEQFRLAAEREREATARLRQQLDAIPRNAKQYMHPELRVPESAIVLPEIERNFEIKSHFISLIKRSQFEGKANECPMLHIKNFIDLCDTIAADNISLEYVQLKAFKWSLAGKALNWLESLPPRSITTWKALYDLFMTKFFPPAKTTELRKKITSFHQLPGETFLETWERFKELQRQCPTHGQPEYVLQEIFFQGINAETKSRLNLHTDCGFLEMTPTDAWALLDKLTEYDAMYGTQEARPSGKKLYEPSNEIDPDVRKQFHDDETRRLKKQVSFLSRNQPCLECGSQAHNTIDCDNVSQVQRAEHYEEVSYMRGPYRPPNYNNNYAGNQNNNYAGRNNHYPNWGNYGQGQGSQPPQDQRIPPYRPPGYQEPPSWVQELKEGFNGLRSDVNSQIKGVQAQLGDLETWKKGVESQLGHLAAQIPRPQGKFPGRPDENPKGQIAAIHLRSGKKVPGRESTSNEEENGENSVYTDAVPSPPGSVPTPLQVRPSFLLFLLIPVAVPRAVPTPLGSVPTPRLQQVTLLPPAQFVPRAVPTPLGSVPTPLQQ